LAEKGEERVNDGQKAQKRDVVKGSLYSHETNSHISNDDSSYNTTFDPIFDTERAVEREEERSANGQGWTISTPRSDYSQSHGGYKDQSQGVGTLSVEKKKRKERRSKISRMRRRYPNA